MAQVEIGGRQDRPLTICPDEALCIRAARECVYARRSVRNGHHDDNIVTKL